MGGLRDGQEGDEGKRKGAKKGGREGGQEQRSKASEEGREGKRKGANNGGREGRQEKRSKEGRKGRGGCHKLECVPGGVASVYPFRRSTGDDPGSELCKGRNAS